MMTTNVDEMQRVISGITSSRARADPSASINLLGPLLATAEGRKLLSKQVGENASVLIDLFDWVAISLGSCSFPRGLKMCFPRP